MTEAFNPRYPIGKYQTPEGFSHDFIQENSREIALFPERIRAITSGLNHQQLAFQYRENSWTIQQLVHHCADSHINAFIRFRKSLTENHPNITGYLEAAWAELPDADEPIEHSLHILKGLHYRWVSMIKDLPLSELNRKGYFHPEYNRVVPLSEAVGLYAWHGKHHLAHIKHALKINEVLDF